MASQKLQFHFFAALGVGASLFLGGAALYTINSLNTAAGHLMVAASAGRNHLETDMMHDAVRSDVLAALLAETNEKRDEIRKELGEHLQIFRAALARNEMLPLEPEIRAALRGVRPALDEYARGAEDMVVRASGNRESAQKTYGGFERLFETLEQRNAEVTEMISKWATAVEAEQAKVYRLGWWLVTISGVLVLAIVASIPLVMRHLLTSTLGELGRRLGNMAKEMTAAASEVSRASNELARGSEEQAASIDEMVGAAREVSGLTSRAAGASRESAQVVGALVERAQSSSGLMNELDRSMQAIQTAGGKVNGILRELDELSFQTSILALNASVEAARAGEAGAGFAVVAEEVRRLAQRSALASEESRQLISDVQKQTEAGIGSAGRLAQFVQGLLGEFGRINEQIQTVNTASQEQVTRVGSITNAVEQSRTITMATARHGQEAAAIAAQMDQQAGDLNRAVGQLHDVVGLTQP